MRQQVLQKEAEPDELYRHVTESKHKILTWKAHTESIPPRQNQHPTDSQNQNEYIIHITKQIMLRERKRPSFTYYSHTSDALYFNIPTKSYMLNKAIHIQWNWINPL